MPRLLVSAAALPRRAGQVATGNLAAGTVTTISVSFSEPFPAEVGGDYSVAPIIEDTSGDLVVVGVVAGSKTADGAQVLVWNRSTLSGRSGNLSTLAVAR